MKKLKVSWVDGLFQAFEAEQQQDIATALVPKRCNIMDEGGALIFRAPDGREVFLVVPTVRLISAVEVEVDDE